MRRRNFIRSLSIGSGAIVATPAISIPAVANTISKTRTAKELPADVIIAGAGMGGCAAAIAALRNGLRVVMTEETDWIGGQLTQQGLSCPDEHPWIESFGATQLYSDLRTAVREYYVRHYPLTEAAKTNKNLNPGSGAVSRLCHEPRVALAVLNNMLAPYLASGKLTLLLQHKIEGADINGDKVKALKAHSLQTGDKIILTAPYFIDATELGDLLPLTKTEYATGAESRQNTHELHAAEKAEPDNNQAFTWCFAMDYLPGENHLIDKPKDYAYWQKLVPDLTPAWPGKLLSLSYSNPSTLQPKALGFDPTGKPTGQMLNLWNYRRIIDRNNFKPGFFSRDISMVNWPQNDYFIRNIIDVTEQEFQAALEQGRQLSLSLFYWLQTEAPRADGGVGWPGLRLRGDIVGTDDGLAKYPYIRESRRIKSVFTILEEHVGKENRILVAGEKAGSKAADFFDSIGIGYYHIDLHPGTTGNNYIDFGSLPFQIPLGALLPQRMQNLIPANKNIGTTHITNGCYRLHPVEWSIGEAAGMLIAFSLGKKLTPHAVRDKKSVLEDFQQFIRTQGIATHWPEEISIS
ncbi:FAD-dependent oxidoreductase [Agriterribacter sp.]|uniref:FAD-dependent oxidoreductase n=1 Tax=Agriterribacter sp. TaxID=2821509 RepID=UPI002C3BDFEB|nr:FAD-dependent oxidoreductase [Agriterribacter sp.]HRO47122.1 FAD-dependent oxidoreductase [Agriterribacter sp.]HRQ17879.1 FAD-dependent oxidoreductase [Agriterribacter sp.]